MNHRSILSVQWLAISLLFSFFGGLANQGGGSGWTRPVDIAETITHNQHAWGFSACDPYQNLHIFWGDYADAGAAIFYRTDEQGSLSAPVDIIQTRIPAIFHLQSVISTEKVFLAWSSTLVGGDLYFSSADLISAGNPRAWDKPQLLASGSGNPSMALDADQAVHLVYVVSDPGSQFLSVMHIVSTDAGESWSDADLILERSFPEAAYINTALSIDDSGRLHVGLTFRSQEYGLFSELGYVRSLDGGKTWSSYKLVEDTSTTFQGVALIAPYAFGKNEVHLTWHDVRRMHMWSTDGGETWSRPEEVMPLGGAFGGFNQIVQDSRGNLHIILAVLDGVYSVQWERGKWNPPEQIDNRPIDPHGQQITVCQGNRLHVLYYDRTGEETVWYSTREVNGPQLQSQPIPTLTPSPVTQAALPSPAVESQPDQRISLDASLLDGSVDQSQARPPFFPILASMLPVAVLVLALLLYKAIRSR